MTEPEYVFKKGEGWVVKPKIILTGKMCWRPVSHDVVIGDEVCPRCLKTYGRHDYWKCPNHQTGVPFVTWGPLEWPCGPEDL